MTKKVERTFQTKKWNESNQLKSNRKDIVKILKIFTKKNEAKRKDINFIRFLNSKGIDIERANNKK